MRTLNARDSSVQFSRSVVTDSLRPCGLQYTRLPCPSPTPRAYSNSCALSGMMSSNHLILCQIHSKKSCALHEISLIIFPENRILKFSNWTDGIVIPSVLRMFTTMLPCIVYCYHAYTVSSSSGSRLL